MRDSRIFDEAVTTFFRPIAQTLKLQLAKVKDGTYEITSSLFIVRIRLHTGHSRGLNVLLRPASEREFDENNPGAEYGIRNFMGLEGEYGKDELIETDADFLKQAERLAEAFEKFGVPYLLGQRKDFDAIKSKVDERTKVDVSEIKSQRFPQNVHEKWIPKGRND